MSVAEQKLAEVLALPAKDRAFLIHRLIASLDNAVDPDAEAAWFTEIDRRSEEISRGLVTCDPVETVVQGLRDELDARRAAS